MRRLLALLLLVPLAAVLVFGCDDVPTEPETAVAATTAQDGSVPTFKTVDKPPALPTPVVLSGWTFVESAPQFLTQGVTGARFALCPEGTAVISGGYWAADATDYLILQNSPVWFEGLSSSGWAVMIKNLDPNTITLRVYAVCVDAKLRQ